MFNRNLKRIFGSNACIFLVLMIRGVGMFFLYLILGNVEEGSEKVYTPYKSFPWGVAIVFL